MSEDLRNVYEDHERASSYAQLEFPGTYLLAFRDLPSIFTRHARGTRALDFGCGAGRSTRFLRDRGFEVTGIDISEAMLERARGFDPAGDYRLVKEGDLSAVGSAEFDLILSAFTFDNIVNEAVKLATLEQLCARLAPEGRIVSVVSSPEIYLHEWASFTTRDFPENRRAKSGEKVLIVMLDVPDRRPVEDILCTDDDYARLYARAGLTVVEVMRPLADGSEGIAWKSETTTAPWVVYVLASG